MNTKRLSILFAFFMFAVAMMTFDRERNITCLADWSAGKQKSKAVGERGRTMEEDLLARCAGKLIPYSEWNDAKAKAKNPTFEINRMSSEFRNRQMYELLARAVNKGERVFAIVGRNHIPMQAPALNCALK